MRLWIIPGLHLYICMLKERTHIHVRVVPQKEISNVVMAQEMCTSSNNNKHVEEGTVAKLPIA